MTDYKITYTVQADSVEEVARKVFTSLYLADLDGDSIRIEAVNGEELFSFPMIQSVTRQLNELRRPASASSPAAEGDWTLYNEDAGGDL